ncbi:MAG: L-aspartate oxidase [Lachnospiraceae bacterium]|nr:L-aspartate oxidase [Lachnospiraceae bacterium]
MERETEVVIVGTGAAGLFCALQIPEHKKITIITKDAAKNSDSFLAQGGICMLRSEEDFASYYEDTMKAGHYRNDPKAVELMIRSSREIVDLLTAYGVEFEYRKGEFAFTREGGHSMPRILFHEDVVGKEITGKLLELVKTRANINICEYTEMIDILCDEDGCCGVVTADAQGQITAVRAEHTVFASGGIGGLYQHSTNFPHLTGDAIAVALRHNIQLKDMAYVQIHPTTLYSEKPGRKFLISESVRGEGAVLYNEKMERFVDELLPRDLVTSAIEKQMEEDGKPYVWLSMEHIPKEDLLGHFPNICQRCLEEGYDVTKECIPVVPGQHYFMGGIRADLRGRTSMEKLYAIGETSCNGVHGANRLASNSLLESLVFAKRAAEDIGNDKPRRKLPEESQVFCEADYTDLDKLHQENRKLVLEEIERMKNEHE